MLGIQLLKTALGSLIGNKARSALTMLGIVIGVASIVLIISIGEGAERLILREIQGFGADTIVIRPGREPTGPTDITETLFADSLKTRDVEALKRKSNVPAIIDVAPILIVPGAVSYRGDTFRVQTFGWSAEFFTEMMNIIPVQGRNFDDADIRARSSVAIIGDRVRRELFGEEEVLGKQLKIKGRNFQIVGVYPPRGQAAFFNIDEMVLIPYTTAQSYLLGTDYFHEIIVRVESAEAVPRTVQDIEITLRELHNITDPEKDDFFVVTQEGVINQISTILGVLTAFLSSVVAIALVVGGIGVMNIMLVSVTERTKEIGLRKAVGATNRDILRQFLLEAILLTGIGGFLGVLIGVLLALAVSAVLSNILGIAWTFSFPVFAAFLGVGMAALVGLVFGIYPARKAARKNPIDALRHE